MKITSENITGTYSSEEGTTKAKSEGSLNLVPGGEVNIKVDETASGLTISSNLDLENAAELLEVINSAFQETVEEIRKN